MEVHHIHHLEHHYGVCFQQGNVQRCYTRENATCKAICQQDGVNYTVTYNPVRKPNIDKDNLIRLKLEHPDIYEQYVTISEFRRFSVKADTKAA